MTEYINSKFYKFDVSQTRHPLEHFEFFYI